LRQAKGRNRGAKKTLLFKKKKIRHYRGREVPPKILFLKRKKINTKIDSSLGEAQYQRKSHSLREKGKTKNHLPNTKRKGGRRRRSFHSQERKTQRKKS